MQHVSTHLIPSNVSVRKVSKVMVLPVNKPVTGHVVSMEHATTGESKYLLKLILNNEMFTFFVSNSKALSFIYLVLNVNATLDGLHRKMKKAIAQWTVDVITMQLVKEDQVYILLHLGRSCVGK